MTDTRTLAERLKEIEDLEGKVFTDLKPAMPLGDYWQSDWVVLGSIKRTLGLASGFRKMIQDQNFTCAAPLVRLQLDCALRLSAMTAVADPEAYAKAFFDGEKMDKFKSSTGAKLSDRYLVNRMKADMPWVEGVYNDTCEFIHLSSRSLFNAIAKMDDEAQKVWFQISAEDPARHGEKKYFEAIEAFKRSMILTTTIALQYLEHRKHKLEERESKGQLETVIHYKTNGEPKFP